MRPRQREEIDFLMETEQALQAQLERVQSRLVELMNNESGAGIVPRPTYLSVVRSDDER